MKCRKEIHRLQQEGGASSAHGTVPDRISRANFAYQPLEGKLNMSSIHKQIAGFATSARRIALLGFLTVFIAVNVWAQGPQKVPDVTTMSVEDLMNMQVTSVSK